MRGPVPVVYEPSNFTGRVNYAADCIARHRCIGTRSFDTCFEMCDGDAVVTALIRRAAKNPRLADGIKALNGGREPTEWHETAAKYATVKTEELPALAERLRVTANAAYEQTIAAALADSPSTVTQPEEPHCVARMRL